MTSKRTTVVLPEQPVEPIEPGTFGSRWAAIADGAVAGAFTLPPSVVAAIAAYNRLHREHHDVAGSYAARFPAYWQQPAELAAGRSLSQRLAADPTAKEDPVPALLELVDAERALGIRRRVLQEAAEQSENFLAAAMSEAAILPALREALDEVYGEVRKLPADTPRTAAEALDAEPGQVDAYRRLQALLGRHGAIRDAQAALRRRIPSKDGRNLFLDSPIAPSTGKAATIGAAIAPAGPPAGTVERLLWLAHDGTGWCPTVAEQDRAFTDWVEATNVTTPGLQFAAHGDTRAIR